MSSVCPPASAGVASLYARAASRVEIYSEVGRICEATPVSDVDPFNNIATITAQCTSSVSDYWVSAVISSPDNILVMTVTLDSPIEVRAGDVVMLTVTLAWS
jgi:hypothetical protein